MRISIWLAVGIMAGSFGLMHAAEAPAPRIVLAKDDTVVTESCVIVIPPGFYGVDANNNGVIQIGADDIKVRFASGSILRGASAETPGDQLRGIGIRVNGHRNVTIENIDVRGFKNGLVATGADGLIVSDAVFFDNYRQHLQSTRQGEKGEDWLYPHHNDERKWRDEYGGALCVENSSNVTIRRVQVRRTQNGIVLDRVNDSAIYDNDCSFLSGWGLALWMSSRNNIQRNAFDFCVRGHFEDVYNRGQDSAGILCFEQSNENIFAENSVTHDGDGFFGFAGHAAIGQTWWDQEKARQQKNAGCDNVDDLIKPPAALVKDLSERGCNGNILIRNDFSDASAHGIELTFSEDNQILRNRVVGNGICGFWGGYSSRTLIAENHFERNGGMSYSLERGAINMEHAADNLILKNNFVNNKCGVHLWWDDDGVLMRFPGVAGNERGVVGNVIGANHFKFDGSLDFKHTRPTTRFPVLQLRDASKQHLSGNYYFRNNVELKNPLAIEFALSDDTQIIRDDSIKTPKYDIPKYPTLGKKNPTMERYHMRGRDKIRMTEWGPEELAP